MNTPTVKFERVKKDFYRTLLCSISKLSAAANFRRGAICFCVMNIVVFWSNVRFFSGVCLS